MSLNPKFIYIFLVSFSFVAAQENIEEIVVTGTLIKDAESDLSPVQIITAKDYENLKKKLANDLNKKKNEEMNKLVELINPILENYLKENSIDILLNKEIVYFAKDKYDISENIISLTNEKYK